MRNLILSLLVVAGTSVYAQTDKMVTTKVKKETKVNSKGELYTTKVKVKTTKMKDTRMNPNQKHQLNQARVASPVTVTKTVMIDNDKDPFYDKATKLKYYKYKGKKYDFSANKNSLLISEIRNNKAVSTTTAVKSKYNNYYIIYGPEFNGIGYFNKDNDFVVEYYDKVVGDTEFAVFEDLKM